MAETDRRTETETDRKSDRQTNKQTGSKSDRQADKLAKCGWSKCQTVKGAALCKVYLSCGPASMIDLLPL